MRDLTTTWYTPPYQPDEANKVEFEVRPLDMPTFWAVQTSIGESGRPGFSGVSAVFEYSVVGWRGLPKEFSREAKRAALIVFDARMAIWLGQICGELYRRALLSEAERKNS